MNRLTGILLVFLLILRGDPCRAYYYKQYTTSDQLLSNTVYHSLTDSKGYLWFFTDRGVSRFDGQRFKNYTGFDGLSELDTYCGYEDKQGRMWLYQGHDRLCFIQHDTVCNSRNNKLLQKLQVLGPFVQKMVETSDSSIYIYSYFGIRAKIKGDRLEWVIREPEHDNPLMTVDTWGDTTVMNKWTSRIFIKNDRIVGVESVKRRLLFNDKGREVVADEDGVKTYDRRNVIFSFDDKRVNNENALHIYRDAEGNIFCGTYEGLYIINMARRDIKLLFRNIKVSCTTQDIYGNYWITTIGNGVFFLDKNLDKIKSLDIDDNYKLFKTNQGQVFFKKKNVFYQVRNDSVVEIASVNSNRADISPIFFSDRYFFYKHHDSSYFLDRKRNALITNKLNITNVYPLPGDSLLTTSWAEVYRFSMTKRNRFDTTLLFENGHFIKSSLDNEHHLLYYISYEKRKAIVYDINTGRSTTIDTFGINDYVTNIHLVNGYVVVLSNDKYMRFYNIAKGYERTVVDKLPFMCYEILARSDKLILNTNKGYYYCDNNRHDRDPRQLIFEYRPLRYPFKASDLQIVEFTPERVLCLVNGSYYSFNDNELAKQHVKPTIVSDSILVNGTARDIMEHPTVHPHPRTSVFLKLRTLKFDNINTSFQYRIINKDTSQWYLSNSGDIDLLFEKYGEYGIEARARTDDGVLSDPVYFSLTILPPFYYSIPFYLLVAVVIAAIIILSIRYYNEKKRKQFESELDYLQLEHKAINSLLNPHFIFNAINNIQNLVNANSNDNANKYLVILSRLVRQNIENLQFNFIPIDKELTLIKNYIHLQNLRFDNRIALSLNNNLPDDKIIQVPPLLIHTFVENSVVHGFKTGVDTLVVSIDLDLSPDNYLIISVKDNGIGFSPKKEDTLLSGKTSMGIAFMRKRLARLSDFYGVAYSLEVTNRKDTRGTETRIMFYALFDKITGGKKKNSPE